MRKIIIILFPLLLLEVHNPVNGFNGTDIWTNGDGLEYAVDLFSGTDNNPLYALDDYPYWIDYQGVEEDLMKFYHHVDRIYIAEWYFGGYEGRVYAIDPETGLDDLGKPSFMFADTSNWTIGFGLGFNFSQRLPDNHLITVEYKVLSDKSTQISADRFIEYWTIGFDDIEYINGTNKYVFQNYAIKVTVDGVMIGKTENYILYTDLNNDTNFSEDEKGYHYNVEFTLTNISSNLESNFIPTSQSESLLPTNRSPFDIFAMNVAIITLFLLSKRIYKRDTSSSKS